MKLLKVFLIAFICFSITAAVIVVINRDKLKESYTNNANQIIYSNSIQNDNQNNSPQSSISLPEELLIPSPTFKIKPENNTRYRAWIPGFDFNNGFSSAQKNKEKLASVHYAGTSILPTGALSFSPNFDQNVSRLNSLGIPLGVNIFSGTNEGTNRLITIKDNKEAIIQKTKDLKSKNKNLKEINLNIEKVSLNDKANLVLFLKDLKQNLNQSDIMLFITIFGQNTDESNPYDYPGIGNAVDKVVLMAYDYNLRANKKAGFEKSIAHDFWVEEILEYAKGKVPFEKIILGLPLYGYGFNKTTGKITTSYTYSKIQSIIASEKLTSQMKVDSGEMFIERENEVIYFQDEKTLQAKIKIGEEAGVGEVMFWRLGGEGELVSKV